jgi:tetratricopeptide (TPR) repeat protein
MGSQKRVHGSIANLGSCMNNSLEAILRESEQLCRQKAHTQALKILDEVLESEPQCYQAWAKRAYVHDAMGDLRNALEDISRTITICALEPAYYDKRGRYLFRLQRYWDAVADFTRVIELCDFHKSDYYRCPAYFARADAYIRLGEYEKASIDLASVPAGHRAWTDRLRTKQQLLEECQRGRGSL